VVQPGKIIFNVIDLMGATNVCVSQVEYLVLIEYPVLIKSTARLQGEKIRNHDKPVR
jgi:hypothetical protein